MEKKKISENKILLKNIHLFENKEILIAGKIPKNLFFLTKCKKYFLYTQKYDIYQHLKSQLYKNIFFSKKIDIKKINKIKYLFFFWSKNKKEIKFILSYLFSILKLNCNIYIIGQKKTGVNSIKKLFHNSIINVRKIDKSNKYLLFKGILLKNIPFNYQDFIKIYTWKNITIQTLPGVFGYNGIDKGSKMLLSTFNKIVKGDVLDIGSGSGILGIFLKKKFPNILLTLIDINLFALWCSRKSLKLNNFSGTVHKSNIYSNIFKKFNLIISNPPIHDDLDIEKNYIINIIINAKKFLKNGGELRLVSNSFLNYDYYFKKTFQNFNIIQKNKVYKVYQSFKRK